MKEESGTLKWFNRQKGYGFIEPDETDVSGRDVLIHANNINSRDTLDRLQEGVRVRFERKTDERSRAAWIAIAS